MVNSNNDQSKSDINTIDNYAVKLERLYVKEINCKIPHAPGLFESTEFKESAGQMVPSIEVSTKVQPVSANKYEVTLHAIVQGKSKNLSLFVLDIQQSGIFEVNVPQEQLKQTIEISCASYLHVYLSQAISNAIIHTGFPPIVLQPLQPIIIKQDLTREQNYNDNSYSDNNQSSKQNIKHVQGVVLDRDNKKSN